MLVISQKKGDKLHIGRDITISIIDSRSGKVRLGIEAPADCPILRKKFVNGNKDNLTPAQADLARYQSAKEKEEKELQKNKSSNVTSDSSCNSALKKNISSLFSNMEDEASKLLIEQILQLSNQSSASDSLSADRMNRSKKIHKKSDRLLKKKAKMNNSHNNLGIDSKSDDTALKGKESYLRLNVSENLPVTDLNLSSDSKQDCLSATVVNNLPICTTNKNLGENTQQSNISSNEEIAVIKTASVHDLSSCNMCSSSSFDSLDKTHISNSLGSELSIAEGQVQEEIIEDPLGLVRSLGDAYIEEPEQESIPSKRRSSRKRGDAVNDKSFNKNKLKSKKK